MGSMKISQLKVPLSPLPHKPSDKAKALRRLNDKVSSFPQPADNPCAEVYVKWVKEIRDLNNMDSLETALTDVDKIVHINSAPRPDEEEFQQKFLGFAKENLPAQGAVQKIQQQNTDEEDQVTDSEWERLESVLEVRYCIILYWWMDCACLTPTPFIPNLGPSILG